MTICITVSALLKQCRQLKNRLFYQISPQIAIFQVMWVTTLRVPLVKNLCGFYMLETRLVEAHLNFSLNFTTASYKIHSLCCSSGEDKHSEQLVFSTYCVVGNPSCWLGGKIVWHVVVHPGFKSHLWLSEYSKLLLVSDIPVLKSSFLFSRVLLMRWTLMTHGELFWNWEPIIFEGPVVCRLPVNSGSKHFKIGPFNFWQSFEWVSLFNYEQSLSSRFVCIRVRHCFAHA